jgi:hypothetical protein
MFDWWKFLWQRLVRGWDDSELWDLDFTIAKFVLPRLKEFRLQSDGFPSCIKSKQEWENILDDIIYAMDATVKQGAGADIDRWQRGLKYWGQYFNYLWS